MLRWIASLFGFCLLVPPLLFAPCLGRSFARAFTERALSKLANTVRCRLSSVFSSSIGLVVSSSLSLSVDTSTFSTSRHLDARRQPSPLKGLILAAHHSSRLLSTRGCVALSLAIDTPLLSLSRMQQSVRTRQPGAIGTTAYSVERTNERTNRPGTGSGGDPRRQETGKRTDDGRRLRRGENGEAQARRATTEYHPATDNQFLVLWAVFCCLFFFFFCFLRFDSCCLFVSFVSVKFVDFCLQSWLGSCASVISLHWNRHTDFFCQAAASWSWYPFFLSSFSLHGGAVFPCLCFSSFQRGLFSTIAFSPFTFCDPIARLLRRRIPFPSFLETRNKTKLPLPCRPSLDDRPQLPDFLSFVSPHTCDRPLSIFFFLVSPTASSISRPTVYF